MSDLLARTSTELATLVRLLWRGQHQDAVHVTAGPVPDGHRLVESYVAVPSLSRARMLLPGGDRAARAGALSHYNRLREPRTRSVRAGLALLARSNLDARLGTALSVCLPVGTSTDERAELLVTSRLASRLGHDRVHVAIGVNRPGPNSKPTLQVFASGGQPLAFVKVGWNELTRGLVTSEARALHDICDDALPGLRRPRTLLHEQWHDLTLLATEPMPLGVRQLPRHQVPEARVHAALPLHTGTLAASAYWGDVLERWGGLRELSGTPARDLAVVDAYLAGVERHWGAAPVETGAWHGDWARWNMARHGAELWVWDWEHFAPMVPVGFDTAHYTFQQTFVAEQRPVARALYAATALAGPSAAQAAVVAATYPVEIYLRAARLHAQGAGWNERFHDGAVDWLSAAAQL